MQDWNVVVTVFDKEYSRALGLLQEFGAVDSTEYFNVLVLRVEDTETFVHAIHERAVSNPWIFDALARVVPAQTTFEFQTPEDFEDAARQAVEAWVTELAGRSFHVRMHRRGFKHRLSSQREEQFLDHFIIETLEARGETARVTFEDPDAIIAVETVGQRAGLSLWTREHLERYPLLHLD